MLIIYAGGNGYLDSVATADVRHYEDELLRFMESRHGSTMKALSDKKAIDDTLKPAIEGALKEFATQFASAAAAV